MKKLLAKILGLVLLAAVGFGIAYGIGRITAKGESSAQNATVYDLIETGDQLYADKHYSQALMYYEEAVQKDSQNATARLRLGQLYQLKNRYNEAEQELLFAEALEPDNPEILYRLATIYTDLHYWDKAQTYLEKLQGLLTADSTEMGKVKYLLGLAYLWQSNFEQAETTFADLLTNEPDNTLARHFLGLLQARTDVATGVATLQIVLDSYPESDIAAHTKAAIDGLRTIDTLDTDLMKRMQLGKVYLEQDMPTLALGYFKQSTEEQPDYQSGHYYLGYTYFLVSDIARALDELQSSLNLGGQPDALAYYYLGEVYTYQQEFAKAADAYERALDAGDEHFETYASLGVASRETGEYSKAAKSFVKALEIDPQSLSARTSLINIYLNFLDDADRAIQAAEEGITLFPENARCYDLLGWALIEKGELAKAESELNKALDLDSDLASAHLNLGALYEQKGLTDKAKDEYQLALDLDFEGTIAPLADKALERLYE